MRSRHTAVDYPIQALLSGVGGQPTKAEEERIRDFYLRYVAAPEIRQQYAELRDRREKCERLEKKILTTMVMSELEKPRDTFILARGDYRNKTDKVEPGTPAVLPPLPKTEGRPNRLTLARWLVDPSHPLTARVAVNRYWQMYFGTGLVKTAENFGSQGEPPSHPELLDWLATEFIRTGWDVKAMQRLIVTSAAYRRASEVTPALHRKRSGEPASRARSSLSPARRDDPRQRARRQRTAERQSRRQERVPVSAGRAVGRDGVRRRLLDADYVQSHGDDLYRRSMYTFWKRTSPPAQLTTFDAPDREKCTARRTITNTPLQALVLLNDPTYLEAARALAERVMKEARDSRTAGRRSRSSLRPPDPRASPSCRY